MGYQGRTALQALIELLAGFIALLAATALSQFGVSLDTVARPDREVHRVSDCREAPAPTALSNAPSEDC